MLAKRVAGLAVACLAAAGLCSCSALRFVRGGADAGSTAGVVSASARSDAERKAVLLKTVQESIDAANDQTPQQREAVKHRNPYFLKAYDVYSGDAEDAKVVIQENDSHSLPYVADVTIEKQRFATRLHRKRADAAKDSDFLRETGVETVTYEYRNGRWKRSGSLFVAEKTEAKVDGEWAAVKGETQRTAPGDETKGWLGRTWSRLTGG